MSIFNKLSAPLIAALFIGWKSEAFAKVKAEAPKGSQDSRLESLIKQAGANVETSAIVVRISNGTSVFEHQSDQTLSPASVTKLLTSAAALYRFGPASFFKTPVFHSGSRAGSRIDGDLIFVGSGDPFLVSEKLWQFAADIRNMGISEITGDIVIDNSLFGDEARDSSRMPGAKQSVNAYDAPVSAFGVNFNTLAIVVSPGLKPGDPPRVGIDPYQLNNTTFDNKATTVKGSGSNIQARRIGDETKNPRIEVTGTIGIDAPLKKIYRSVGDYVASSGEYVRSFLAAEGVKVSGKIKEGRKPVNASHLVDIEGYDLRKITQGLNVFSNNYIADVLLKKMGSAFPPSGPAGAAGQGTLINGLKVMKDFLSLDVKISTPMVLENGSGLDTRNRLSARQVASVLTFMESKMVVFPDYIGGLPAYGWDGTLKKRAKDAKTSVHGMARAKTGTLSEPITVVSLAGYTRHREFGLVAFAVIQNGKKGAPQPSVSELRELQDDFVAALID